MKKDSSQKKRVFSLELAIVVLIPVLTVLASIATLVLASQLGFTAQEDAAVDRFGREQSAEP